jgi:cell division transport system ATP-binding protein
MIMLAAKPRTSGQRQQAVEQISYRRPRLFSTSNSSYSLPECTLRMISCQYSGAMKAKLEGFVPDMSRENSGIVQFDNVGLRYGTDREVLSDVSFSLFPGSFYFLTGASGAGKTSLLRLLYLAQRPSRGMIRMFGQDVITMPRDRLPAVRRRIGTVFQDFRLVPHLSAYDNVALPLRISGMDEAEIREPVTDMLEWVGLEHRIDARPATLSGGEQQRVAIARAVIARPEILVADEPTGNVDPEMALKLLRLFEALNRLGTTVVVATHDLHLLRKVPDSLIMRLDKGRLSDPTGALRYPPQRERMGS